MKKYFIFFVIYFIFSLSIFSEETEIYKINQIYFNENPVTKNENVFILTKNIENQYEVVSSKKEITGWRLLPDDLVQISSQNIKLIFQNNNNFIEMKMSNQEESILWKNLSNKFIQYKGTFLYNIKNWEENIFIGKPNFEISISKNNSIFEIKIVKNNFSIKVIQGEILFKQKSLILKENDFLSGNFDNDKTLKTTFTNQEKQILKKESFLMSKNTKEIYENLIKTNQPKLNEYKKIEDFYETESNILNEYKQSDSPFFIETVLEKKLETLSNKTLTLKDFETAGELAKLKKNLGDTEESQKLFLEYLNKLKNEKSSQAGILRGFYSGELGEINNILNDYEETLKYYQNSIDEYFIVYQDDYFNVKNIINLAKSYLRILDFYQKYGENQNSLSFSNKVIDLLETGYKKNPDNIDLLKILSKAYFMSADIYLQNKNTVKANDFFKKSEELIEKLFDKNQKDSQLLQLYADCIFSHTKTTENDKSNLRSYKKIIDAVSKNLESNKNDFNLIQILVKTYTKMGNIYINEDINKTIGEYEKGIELLEKNQLFEKNNFSIAHQLFEEYHKSGNLILEKIDEKKSLPYFEKLINIQEYFYSLFPDVLIKYNKLAGDSEILGNIYFNLNDYKNSLRSYMRSYEIKNFLYLTNNQNVNFGKNMLSVYEKIIDLEVMLGNLNDALDFAEKKIEISRKVVKNTLNIIDENRNLSIDYNDIGDIYFELGQYDNAVSNYKESFKIRELINKQRNDRESLIDLSTSYVKLGESLLKKGNNPEENYKKALEIREKMIVSEPENSDIARNLGIVYSKLTDLYLKQNDLKNAQLYSQKDVDICEKNLKKDPQSDLLNKDLYVSLTKLGDVFLFLNNYEQSSSLYTRSLEIIEKLYNKLQYFELSKDLSTIYKKNGYLYNISGKYDKSISYYLKYISFEEKYFKNINNPAKINELSATYIKIGEDYFALNDFKNAIINFQNAINIGNNILQNNPDDYNSVKNVSLCYSKIGDSYYKSGDLTNALKFYQLDFNNSKKIFDKENNLENAINVATSLFNIGIVYRERKETAKSNKSLFESLKYLKPFENNENANNNSNYKKLMELIKKQI